MLEHCFLIYLGKHREKWWCHRGTQLALPMLKWLFWNSISSLKANLIMQVFFPSRSLNTMGGVLVICTPHTLDKFGKIADIYSIGLGLLGLLMTSFLRLLLPSISEKPVLQLKNCWYLIKALFTTNLGYYWLLFLQWNFKGKGTETFVKAKQDNFYLINHFQSPEFELGRNLLCK